MKSLTSLDEELQSIASDDDLSGFDDPLPARAPCALRSQGASLVVVTKRRHIRVKSIRGSKKQKTDSSEVECPFCGHTWRTKAKYVKSSPDAPSKWCEMSRQDKIAWCLKHGKS